MITDSPDGLVLRRCIRTFTDDPPYEDVILPDLSAQDVIGNLIHVRIEATGINVTTYINDNKVDTYACSRRVLIGKSGIRVEPGDEALFDNFQQLVSHPNGNSRTYVSEDFSGSESVYFIDANIVDGQCIATTNSAEYKLLSIDYSYPTFYRFFNAEKSISSAMLYTSALGIYDVWINGQRVGVCNDDGTYTYDELKPGWTDYNNRVFYTCYDVTSLCNEGENNIGAIVTPGWLKGQIARLVYEYPLDMAFIGKLEIIYSDGTKETIVTDESWSTEKFSPILKSDIYHGEYVDGRRPLSWTEMDTSMPCKPQIFDYNGKIEELCGPTVRIMKDLTLRPVKTVVYTDVEKNKDYGVINELYSTTNNEPLYLKVGETAVVDFGQNCAGVPLLKVKGESGARIHIRFGEMLNDSGMKSRGNDGPAGSLYTENLRQAKAELYYVLNGDPEGETYIPTSTFFGYRYCDITTTDDVTIVSIETCPLSSSHQITGSFETDNDDVNQLFSNILWSQLSNFISIPTDCPQRDERLGWTADAQVFAKTAMYNANVGPFYRKWLCDIRDSQREDGAYSDVSPISLIKYGTGGWADTGIVLPWDIYMMTGDKDAISEHYESMERYMSWLSTLTVDGLIYPGGYATYGDLFAPHPVDRRFVSQAYYYYDAVLMAKMSKLLSAEPNDSYYDNESKYRSLSDAIKQEIQSQYFNETGLIDPTQGSCVISLWLELYSDEQQKQSILNTLIELIRKNNYRLDTGFISTQNILQILSDNGYSDIAYELLTQHDYPSWMYMLDNGATTIWENWYCYRPETGFDKSLGKSFNHFGLGSFGSWLYSHVAGIKICDEHPGFKKVLFSPYIDMRENCEPNRKINRAKATKQTETGLISAEWHKDENSLTYDINVPEGVEGEVHMPVTSPDVEIYESSQVIVESDRIMPLGYQDGRKIYAVKPGEYHFSTSNKVSSIPIQQSDTLNIWPNPAKTEIHISLCEEEIKEVNIVTLSGEVVYRINDGRSTIDISFLPQGFYLVSIKTPQATYIKKLMKI